MNMLGLGLVVLGAAMQLDSATFRAQIEADWLLQESARCIEPVTGTPTPQEDASGGCDGVKNGRWGFHTSHVDSPWWQVDLGAVVPLDRAVLWNRCDAADRNNAIRVLLSSDGENWRVAYTHNGSTFFGFSDSKPLSAPLGGEPARFVRVQVPGMNYLHLDEVEVFGTADPQANLALQRPANQIDVSQWSSHHVAQNTDWPERVRATLGHLRSLPGADPAALTEADAIEAELPATADAKALYLRARWAARSAALADPELSFDSILLTKRVPGSFNHMSDQYYGWWSRPGGGLYILRDYRTPEPKIESITDAFAEPGSFLRPTLSFDGRKVLFAWCKYYPGLAEEADKLNKNNVPEDAFYHVFEMNVDGSGVRKLTHGKYDDFDARYLPDGHIVFLSTRRGQSIQAGRETAALTLARQDLPDCYVRCGGGPERPVAVYTLHTMDADGGELNAISAFEMFEWTPSVANDGTVLYSRWDYIDRWNMPFMSLWSTRPDGTNPRLVYGNFTHSPHCTFEPQSIPGSNKIVFTASGHHAQTMGSLVLLDPSVGDEGTAPITRLTPEVCFPEIEGWPTSYFTSPWPLSERLYLVAWGLESAPVQGQRMLENGTGIYLFNADGFMDLVYRDPEIASIFPLPLAPRPAPPVIPSTTAPAEPEEGRYMVADVYRGLKTVQRGDIKSLRIVAVPAKTHPTMNAPSMGLTKDDPGKCVLGTVPVEPDGSAYFRVPSGVNMFFQALDANGMAVQTMRSITYVQPGQTLGCVGCHEPRQMAAPGKPVMAAVRAPSRLKAPPEGAWPLRFDKLVKPVLDKHCVKCHRPDGDDPRAATRDFSGPNAYDVLCASGKPSLTEQVTKLYKDSASRENEAGAKASPFMAMLTGGHHDVKLDPAERDRLVTWLDTYAQRLGSFSEQQEQELLAFRQRINAMIEE